VSDATQRRTTPSREGDKLLTLEQISERTTIKVDTLRYLRHRGELPFVFRLHRRLVGWQSDTDAYIEAAAARDAQARAS
jgi:predicted DNA-binding transcriptional regulator AlpA